jgi:hypothetical protein
LRVIRIRCHNARRVAKKSGQSRKKNHESDSENHNDQKYKSRRDVSSLNQPGKHPRFHEDSTVSFSVVVHFTPKFGFALRFRKYPKKAAVRQMRPVIGTKKYVHSPTIKSQRGYVKPTCDNIILNMKSVTAK